MIYEYNIRKKAMKFISRQNRRQQEQILKAIYSLPTLGDIVKMRGEDNLYRLRVGDYRVIFELQNKELNIILVDVTNAGNRGQIYKTK